MAHSWTSLSLSHLLYYTVIFQFKSLFVIIFTHQNTQKKKKHAKFLWSVKIPGNHLTVTHIYPFEAELIQLAQKH